MRRGLKLIQILVFIAALSLTFVPARFALADDLWNKIDELEREKDNLYQNIERNREVASQKKAEARQLESEIADTEVQIADTQTKINDTQQKINTVNGEIVQTREEIAVKEQELQIEKEKLNQALIEIYRSTSRSSWEIVLSAGSLSDFADQTKYLEKLESRIEEAIGQINKIKEQLEAKKTSLEEKVAQLRQLQEQQVMFRRAAEVQRNRKEALKSNALTTAEEAISAARESEQRIGSIDAAIREALEQSGGKSSGHLTGQDVSAGTVLGYMGSTGNSTGPHLHLEVRYNSGYGGDGSINDFLNTGSSNPVSNCSVGMDGNDLVYNFGLNKPLRNPWVVTACWPEYLDGGHHDGVDMVENSGALVLAARGGRVVFHGYCDGWGNMAVIYHGGGLWTLYGHMM